MKVNLSYLQEMSAGNQALILEMIAIFCEQVEEFNKGLAEHLQKQEYELLGKLAHKAKSSVSIMGLTDLAADLKNLELMAKSGKNPEKYATIVDRFKKETSEAVNELNQVIENLELYL